MSLSYRYYYFQLVVGIRLSTFYKPCALDPHSSLPVINFLSFSIIKKKNKIKNWFFNNINCVDKYPGVLLFAKCGSNFQVRKTLLLYTWNWPHNLYCALATLPSFCSNHGHLPSIFSPRFLWVYYIFTFCCPPESFIETKLNNNTCRHQMF